MTIQSTTQTPKNLNKFRSLSPELSLSLMISMGALRMVNTVERTLNQLRHHKVN